MAAAGRIDNLSKVMSKDFSYKIGTWLIDVVIRNPFICLFVTKDVVCLEVQDSFGAIFLF